MKNPLIKRLPRELRRDFAKYIILFLFLTGVIGFVSGFIVASNSTIAAYDESFEKYDVEDGNFELLKKASDETIASLENGLKIYENFYFEFDTEGFDSSLRIFKNRTDVNRACLMSGEFPADEGEIALDRMYAVNNKLEIGDKVKVCGKELEIVGLVALSDYSALFQSTSDMMFDATRFGVSIVTEETFDSFEEGLVHYSYSWKYDIAPADDKEEKEMSEELLEKLGESVIVTNFVPQFVNQAIIFTGSDMGNDRLMFTFFLYLVIMIIAFIFAITTSNTIVSEANVIGTLRASGYTRGELIRHYMTTPMFVIFVSAILGNILGYTFFEDLSVKVYYQSYCLPTYVTRWSPDAFIKTTVVPVIIMLVINYCILSGKLKLSPLKFIRGDLSKKEKKRAMKLNEKHGIMGRFRTRVILQNIPNYVTIFFGIFFANVIMLFGVAMPALLDHYQDEIQTNMICDYQYMLKTPVETDTPGVEKYSAGGLKTMEGKLKSEDVTLFGIEDNSKYVDIDFDSEGVYISNALSEKFDVNTGDTLKLKDEYADKEYSFEVAGVYYYPAGISVFMKQEDFNSTFGYEADYFNGYFSDSEIEDINSIFIATTITEEDLTKTSRQLDNSLGAVIDMFAVFGVVMFMLIIFLLSKIVIEKNAQSISMTKILGYNDREISSLYITSTTIVVIASLVITLPIVDFILSKVIVLIMSEYAGYLPYYVPFGAYVKIIIIGIAAYTVVAAFQFRKVRNIPMDMALKNRE